MIKCDKCNNEAKYFYTDIKGNMKRLCIKHLQEENNVFLVKNK